MGAINPPNDQGEFTIDFRSTPPIRTLTFKDRLGLGGQLHSLDLRAGACCPKGEAVCPMQRTLPKS